MVIASLRLELKLTRELGSWRKKRLIRLILQKIHRSFNVSVIQVDRFDHPTEAVLAVVSVGLNRRELRSTLLRVAKTVSILPQVELIGQTVLEAETK